MAKPPSNQNPQSDVGTPKEFPNTTPPVDLYAISDIRFVMRDVASLSTKVDRLISDVEKNSEKVSDMSKKVASFETAAKVTAALIVAFGAFLWWVLGDLIKVSVAHAVRGAVMESSRPIDPPKPPGSGPSAQK